MQISEFTHANMVHIIVRVRVRVCVCVFVCVRVEKERHQTLTGSKFTS